MHDTHPARLNAMPKRRRHFSLSGLISLPVLIAFGAYSLPARAMPEASLQLFRVNRQGFTAVPAVASAIQAIASQNQQQQGSQIALSSGSPSPANSGAIRSDAGSVDQPGRPENPGSESASISRISPPTAARSQLVAQVDPSTETFTLRQTFIAPLPRNLRGNIRVVLVGEDGTLGNILEEIPFNSRRVVISRNRTELTVYPSVPAPRGQLVMLQLPSRSPEGVAYVYPNHLESTPCIARVPAPTPQAVAPTPVPAPAAAAAAAAGFSAIWIVVGAVVVGAGVCAAAGCFSGGGGGGTNTSSR